MTIIFNNLVLDIRLSVCVVDVSISFIACKQYGKMQLILMFYIRKIIRNDLSKRCCLFFEEKKILIHE